MNIKSQGLLTCIRSVQGRIVFSGVLLLATASLLSLSGCSMDSMTGAPSSSGAGVALKGVAFGGQQPVKGGTIQLYSAPAAGAATVYSATNTGGGYAQPATALISATVKTAADGSFNITGDWSCPGSPNDLVYLTATGGDAGSGTNNNLVLMAALGPCGNINSGTFIKLNEVTTVASVYALSGFMSDATHVGTSSTNYTGLKNAFATVNNLVNIATGTAYAVTPDYATQASGTIPSTFKSVVPQAELNSLGNIISSCVNSAGGASGDNTACGNLFAAATLAQTSYTSTGVAPTDTVQAVLSIAQNPANNASTIYGLAPTQPPFSPALSTTPNDWSVALNFTGGGLGGETSASTYSAPTYLALDGSGDVWVSNGRSGVNSITELSNLGKPLSPSTTFSTVVGSVGSGTVTTGGFKGGGLTSPQALAVDLSGNVWAANNEFTTAAISELNSAGVAVSGSPFSGGGLSLLSRAIAIDGYNNVWVSGGNAIAEFNASGTALSGTSGYTTDISSAFGIAVDASENVWIANGGNGFVVKMNNSGTYLINSTANVNSPTDEPAIDANGGFWLGQAGAELFVSYWDKNMLPLTGNFNYLSNTSATTPQAVTVDGANHVWSIDTTNLAEIDASTGNSIGSGGISGYTGVGTGLFVTPKAGDVDSSGNLWFMNGVNFGSVTEFVGVAAPTITPKALAVKNNTIGTRP